MSRSGLRNRHAVPDAAQSWNFDLFFTSIPGASDTMQLSYRCKSATLPGISIDAVEIALGGMKKIEAGQQSYSEHQFDAVFMEVIDFSTRDVFENWIRNTRNWRGNTGMNSNQYKTTAEIHVYDFVPNVTKRYKIIGMWAQNLTDYALDGTSANTALDLTVTFKFDDIEPL